VAAPAYTRPMPRWNSMPRCLRRWTPWSASRILPQNAVRTSTNAPYNSDTISLRRVEWQAPGSLPLGESTMVPLRAGEALRWQVIDSAGH
jgi:hypothetical protein